MAHHTPWSKIMMPIPRIYQSIDSCFIHGIILFIAADKMYQILLKSPCDVNRRSDLNVNGLCVWTAIIFFSYLPDLFTSAGQRYTGHSISIKDL